MDIISGLILVPVVGGSLYALLCIWASWRFFSSKLEERYGPMPPATVLKPCYGIDRDMKANLESLIDQDYPEHQDYPEIQVILSVQRLDDPCIPILEEMKSKWPDRVDIVIAPSKPTLNGKVQNMIGALPHVRHELIVISDSDARAGPGYLRHMLTPLQDPEVGYVCSLYRVADYESVADALELLSINTDFVPSILFAYVTGASSFCLGASTALQLRDLNAIGGLESLADYLVEDYEMGRRLRALGKKAVLIPDMVDLSTDYANIKSWYEHMVYWDQNTCAANRIGFFLTILTRAIPFAILYALIAPTDPIHLGIAAIAILTRLGSAAVIAGLFLQNKASLKALPYLPLRDCLGLFSWIQAQLRGSFTWRGVRFGLTREGRIYTLSSDRD